jgi:predicted RNA-binding protein with PIN domain
MAYLIDGNNLLGALFASELRDPAARGALVRALQAFQKQTRTRVILVFDGAPPADVPASGNEKFTVVFPAEGESADATIEDRIVRSSDPRHLFVVSSDREIRAFAKAHGATPLGCDIFHREMKKALRARREARSLEKRDEAATPLEVELWAKAFTRDR